MKAVGAIAGGFAGFLSLFNIVGRLAWASMSDRLSRRLTYTIFFLLGIALYSAVPSLAASGNKAAFALALGVILSMYGGGFATIPAYLADLFGTGFVGAIHGRLLTAWSMAGVVGPILVTELRQFQIDAGVERRNVYDHTMYILAALLLGGLVCNLLIRPVRAELFVRTESKSSAAPVASLAAPAKANSPVLAMAWLAVALPLAWGFSVTLSRAAMLFR